MKLTAYGGSVDSQIEKMLTRAVDQVVAGLPGIQSVLLAGGFGRGEGSVELADGKPVPINDFELFAITTQPVLEDQVNAVAAAATAAAEVPRKKGHSFTKFDREIFSDTFYVDLKVIQKSKLAKLLPMIRYYELKHASRVVWGEDLRSMISDTQVAELPLAEGLRVLLNRMAMLCLYFDTAFFTRPLHGYESRALQYLAAKSVLDIPTALLLLNGRFVPSYKQRAQIFAQTAEDDFGALLAKDPQIVTAVKKAAAFKLKPDFSKQKDPIATWIGYRDHARAALKFYMEKMFGQQVTTTPEVVQVLGRQMAQSYYKPYLARYLSSHYSLQSLPPGTTWAFQRYYNGLMAQRMLTTQGKNKPGLLIAEHGYDIHLFMAMICLLDSIDEKGAINESIFELALKNLSAIYPLPKNIEPSITGWQQLNTIFADAYVLFGYLKLV